MKLSTRKITMIGMLCAIAFVIVAFVRIPVVAFLKYEPKDVVVTIGGFIFGPLSAFLISAVVSLVEMVTISDTGIIGCIMNLLSTCAFACTAAFIYKKQHSIAGAMTGLVTGTIAMVALMLLWNYLITPYYMGYPREAVTEMLMPVFLPFNLLKGGLNAGITLLIYKPVVNALRRARLLEAPSEGTSKKSSLGVALVGLLVLVTCVFFVLVLQGIL